MSNYHTSSIRKTIFVPSTNVRNFSDPAVEKAENIKLKRSEASFIANQAEKLKNHNLLSIHNDVNSMIESGVALLSSVFEQVSERNDERIFEPDEFMIKNIEEFNIMAQNETNVHETILKMMDDFDLHRDLFKMDEISEKVDKKLKKNNAVILSTPQQLEEIKNDRNSSSKEMKSTDQHEQERSQLIREVADQKIYLPSSVLRTKQDLHYDHDFYNSLTDENKKYLVQKYNYNFYDEDKNFNVKMFGKQHIVFIDRLNRLKLSRDYGKYVYNIDDLIHFNAEYDKYKFIKYHSMMTNNWRPYNNYFRELVANYRELFKDKILMADSPNQINKSLYYQSKNIILFELKNYDEIKTKREKLDEDFLKKLNNPKYHMKYEYMMYFIFSFFKRDDYEDDFKSDG